MCSDEVAGTTGETVDLFTALRFCGLALALPIELHDLGLC